MNLDNVKISVIEEVELKTGFLIEELFADENKSPYRKRAMAYLSAVSRGENISWDSLANLTVVELLQLMQGDEDLEKKE